MTRAYVLYFPATTATITTPIIPNWCDLNSHNSVIFEAWTLLKFCMEVDTHSLVRSDLDSDLSLDLYLYLGDKELKIAVTLSFFKLGA